MTPAYAHQREDIWPWLPASLWESVWVRATTLDRNGTWAMMDQWLDELGGDLLCCEHDSPTHQASRNWFHQLERELALRNGLLLTANEPAEASDSP